MSHLCLPRLACTHVLTLRSPQCTTEPMRIRDAELITVLTSDTEGPLLRCRFRRVLYIVRQYQMEHLSVSAFFFGGREIGAVPWFPVSRAAFPAREKAGTARTKSLLSKSRGSSTSFDDADRWKRTALTRKGFTFFCRFTLTTD